MTSQVPGVLFVCVKNGGKSQMAGALMRHAAGTAVRVFTAGTAPGTSLNTQSVESLTELGIDLGTEHPKPITHEVLDQVDLIITLGKEAVVDPVEGIQIRQWDTDEPSLRGIKGMERMRLIRDDIKTKVQQLLIELTKTV
ncbi:arsenate-mycothiol transferase [Psychromicrobium silvestre]|uniref:Arsenate-mycothiol transferase n=1 Tax=Psychromicrobium silvestre TaxID=1645614 RepID=A0A7Y9LUJ8_9MICC|nr:low molecular weight phosphatase family protein [Psychromicrobium silvestre]NYE95888.1 arsenate-mycothiol transferase [Psychromicrobium silvestre]